MIINVMSLHRATNVIIDNKHLKNWISIRDNGYPEIYIAIDKFCNNVCALEFDDITHYNVTHDLIMPMYKEIKEKRELIYFDKTHAKQIIEFADKIYRSGEELNIHCFAGKSRSQAVGYALNVYYNLYLNDNQEHFLRNLEVNNYKFMPNSEILQIMNDVLYLNQFTS